MDALFFGVNSLIARLRDGKRIGFQLGKKVRCVVPMSSCRRKRLGHCTMKTLIIRKKKMVSVFFVFCEERHTKKKDDEHSMVYRIYYLMRDHPRNFFCVCSQRYCGGWRRYLQRDPTALRCKEFVPATSPTNLRSRLTGGHS